MDLLLLYLAPTMIFGQLCDDIQTLCFVSIIVNFSGWLLYLAYAPPSIYNFLMWSLSYVQLARLFVGGNGDVNHLGLHMVRRHHS